jgi:O-methyltransferase
VTTLIFRQYCCKVSDINAIKGLPIGVTVEDTERSNWIKAKELIQEYQTRLSFKQLKTGLAHSLVIPSATYSPWLDDQNFQQILESVSKNTLVDTYRLWELYQISHQLREVDGDVLEVGVWRGGSGALIADVIANQNKTIYLADTFMGVVLAGESDSVYIGGEHKDTSVEMVDEVFMRMGLTNYKKLIGEFPKETSNEMISTNLSMVHIDVDVYSSAKGVWEWIQPYLGPRSIVVFDDYGFISCSGVTKFVNEIKEDSSYHFVHNLNGHAIFIKIC